MFDVIAVNIKTNRVRVLEQDKDERNAEAVMKMAVRLRGVNEEFFVVVPRGRYRDGDAFKGR